MFKNELFQKYKDTFPDDEKFLCMYVTSPHLDLLYPTWSCKMNHRAVLELGSGYRLTTQSNSTEVLNIRNRGQHQYLFLIGYILYGYILYDNSDDLHPNNMSISH